MKGKLVTLLFAAVLVALASTAMASTTWYVNGVSGSNSNACTSPPPQPARPSGMPSLWLLLVIQSGLPPQRIQSI